MPLNQETSEERKARLQVDEERERAMTAFGCLVMIGIVIAIWVGCVYLGSSNYDSDAEWQKTKEWERKRDTGL
jgi:hypothetical protein